ncbi:MAG: hypothetical protein GY805_20420 [Chloroflexi bacterium]|nr:hypothetical protein [Chloroflexota bacterium]
MPDFSFTTAVPLPIVNPKLVLSAAEVSSSNNLLMYEYVSQAGKIVLRALWAEQGQVHTRLCEAVLSF